VLEVLDARSLFRYYGPDLRNKVAGFEQALAASLEVPHAVATSSGTAALRVALAALGVGCGDEVIVPAFTFVATVNAVVLAGAVPVFAEVDDTLNLDAESVRAVVSPRTAAVIPVHLENVACDLDPLLAVTAERGLAVLEDAAQALGVRYKGRALGTIGTLGAFSFQLEKNITSGEGGAVVSSDPDLALRAARYQDQGGQFVTGHGSSRGGELDEPFVGENLRMTEIAGAIAGVQLGRLPDLLARMRANRIRIAGALGEIPGLMPRRSPDPAGAVVRRSAARGGDPDCPALWRAPGLCQPGDPRAPHGLQQGWPLALRRAPDQGGLPDGHVPAHRGPGLAVRLGRCGCRVHARRLRRRR